MGKQKIITEDPAYRQMINNLGLLEDNGFNPKEEVSGSGSGAEDSVPFPDIIPPADEPAPATERQAPKGRPRKSVSASPKPKEARGGYYTVGLNEQTRESLQLAKLLYERKAGASLSYSAFIALILGPGLKSVSPEVYKRWQSILES